MTIALQRKLAWILLLAGSILLSCIPLLYVWHVTGSFIPRVLPEMYSDQLYYLVQFKELLAGKWLLGNPYLLEYSDLRSPSLLLPVWVAAVPVFLGIPINVVFFLNIFLYTIVCSALFYFIVTRACGARPLAGASLALLGIASAHDLIGRPVSMQVIFPVFLLWVWIFLSYVEHPHDRTFVLLTVLGTALTFYWYTHLWMITFTVLGVHTLVTLLRRDLPSLLSLCRVWAGILVLCLPQIILVYGDITNPLFADLSYRVGVLRTHVIRPLSLLNNKYLFLSLAVFVLLLRSRRWSRLEYGMVLITCGVILVKASNLITGVTLEFFMIPWRFSLLLLPILLLLIFRLRKEPGRFLRVTSILASALLLATTVNRVFPRANAFPYMAWWEEGPSAYERIARYANLFEVLETQEPNTVVMAPLRIANYIPLYTDDYVLLAQPARLHPVPSAELLERFLMLEVDHADRNILVDNLKVFAGAGPFHELDTVNDCAAMGFCSDTAVPGSPIDLLGGVKFLKHADTLRGEINRAYASYLRKYHVAFIVTDTEEERNPRVPRTAVKLWSENGLTLYDVRPSL